MFVKSRQKKGITLIEMIISVLILGLALGAMLGSFVMGRVSATKAKHRIEVMNLLRGKMEEIKDTDYAAILDDGPDPVTIDAAGAGLTGTMIVDVTEIVVDGYKKVDVTVTPDDLSWSEGLVTIVSR